MENVNQSVLPPQQTEQNSSSSRLPLLLLFLGGFLLAITLLYSILALIIGTGLYEILADPNQRSFLRGMSLSSRMQISFIALLIPIIPFLITYYGFKLYRKQKNGMIISKNEKLVSLLIIFSLTVWLIIIPLYSIQSSITAINSVTNTQSAPKSISPTISALENSTANWKTYTNKKLGFSFEYPSNLEPQEGSRSLAYIGKANFVTVGFISIEKEENGHW